VEAKASSAAADAVAEVSCENRIRCPARDGRPRRKGRVGNIGGNTGGNIEYRGNTVSIVENKKAYHDYFVEEKFEAGLALEGWEVKAIRAGRAQLKEAYVVVKSGEIVLLGAHITPLATASTHIKPDPTRTRKLLMHRLEINRLMGKVQRAGYTLTPLNLHFNKGRVKLDIGLARGKKQYDKRETEKLRDWTREKQRLLRNRSGAGRTSRSG
jgi:SsrA-binding protein